MAKHDTAVDLLRPGSPGQFALIKSHKNDGEKAMEQCICDLCGRERRLTKHHLVPRAVHRKKRYVNRFGKQDMRTRSLMICRECHNGIHDLIPDEKELADKYHTKDLLLANPAISKHIDWVRKQK